MAVQRIPAGYHTVTPYLIIQGVARAIEFYKQAFEAVEVMRIPGPEGRVMHAEIQIGDSSLMMSDECPDPKFRGPQSLGGTPVTMMMYVEDVDAQFARAVAAGAITVQPVANTFYGDRAGTLIDPFGHSWCMASRIENVSAEVINRRMQQMMSKPANSQVPHADPAV